MSYHDMSLKVEWFNGIMDQILKKANPERVRNIEKMVITFDKNWLDDLPIPEIKYNPKQKDIIILQWFHGIQVVVNIPKRTITVDSGEEMALNKESIRDIIACITHELITEKSWN